MTEQQQKDFIRLAQCTFLPGSPQKRFVRDMAAIARNNPAYELSDRQSQWLDKLMHSYRKQLENIA